MIRYQKLMGFPKAEVMGHAALSFYVYIVPKLKRSVQEVLDNALEDRGRHQTMNWLS